MEEDSTTLTEEQFVQFLSCLNEETSGDLFIALLVAGAEAEGTKVGEMSIACMQELLQGVNIVALFAAEDNSPEAEEFIILFFGLFACVEDPFHAGAGGQPDTSPDDHGDNIDDATPIAVGEAVQGALGRDDKDAFVIHAEAGYVYEAALSDYSLGYGSFTITSDPNSSDATPEAKPEPEPLITVYDSEGRELARLGEDSIRKVVEWQSGTTGNNYVVVGDGRSQGDYTLTVRLTSPHQGVAQPTPEDPETIEQGFVVPEVFGLTSALELAGAFVCVLSGSQAELNLADFAERNNLNIYTLTFDDIEAVLTAYLSGQCDAAYASLRQLATLIDSFAPDPSAHVILPDVISD